MTSLYLATAFLSRIPVPARDAPTAQQMAGALPYFPVVGVGIGGVGWCLVTVLHGHLPAPLIAVLFVALGAAITGGLHLDGLADVFDAVGGGRGDRERSLAIMRDSRIGAHGATALGLHLIAKTLACTELCRAGGSPALWTAAIVARAGVVPLIVGFNYARPDGLGRAFHEHGKAWHAAMACGVGAAAVAVMGSQAVAPAVGAAAVALGLAGWLRWRLGGLTGDGYGAAIELAEIAFYLVAAAGGG